MSSSLLEASGRRQAIHKEDRRQKKRPDRSYFPRVPGRPRKAALRDKTQTRCHDRFSTVSRRHTLRCADLLPISRCTFPTHQPPSNPTPHSSSPSRPARPSSSSSKSARVSLAEQVQPGQSVARGQTARNLRRLGGNRNNYNINAPP